jgi:hypothetical protein
MSDTREIKRFAIYPSIGVARVGNSPDGYFFGPELPGPIPPDPGGYRDASGRIKRQAARFRVYGLDADGKVVKEITAADARITWKVEVANKKAAWFDFDQAFDIPASKGELADVAGTVSTRRNADVVGDARKALAITPPRRAVSGPDVNRDGRDPDCAFEGTCFEKPVYLGELRTDAEGRLIFLGGRGVSASKDGTPAQTFANNDGWYDDVCDGPVDALVEYPHGAAGVEATGAWVVVAPPNYAPGIQGMITGYDLILQVAAAGHPGLLPEKPRFFEHIYPMLRRLTAMQWVNAGFARDFGSGTPYDLESPELVARLSQTGEPSATLRQGVFAFFRNATYPYLQPVTLPGFYGDAVTLNVNTTDPREWMAVLDTQYTWLAAWAKGDFIADERPPALSWDKLDAAEQVRLIDRGVLDETLGGPFHPGCEFTWPMRNAMMYDAPFRIKRRTGPEPDFGTMLTSEKALAVGGPLDGSTAGDITRWMAVPWQTDTSSCLSGYIPYVDDYLPTFWPARVPNDVLSAEQYKVILSPESSIDDKEKAFAYDARVKWLSGIVYEKRVAFPPMTYSPYTKGINQFIGDWWQVGIIVEQPGPAGAPFPRSIWVETGRQISPVLRALAAGETLVSISEHPRFRRR